jgi:hypothetical protein
MLPVLFSAPVHSKMGWSAPNQITYNSIEDAMPSINYFGTKVAFESSVGGDSEIFVVNSDGTGLTQLTDNTAWDEYPSISGDGTKIAFHSYVDGDDEIFVVNSDGTGLTQLTTNTANDRYPSINGDGTKVAFYSDVDGDNEIFVTSYEPELYVDGLTTWYWTDNTTINTVTERDVDNDGSTEIATGGYYFDGIRDVAQLVVWDGSTLAVDRLTTWFWTNNTRINSVAVGNLDEDEALEIITGGYYYDNTRKIAQLVVWDGSTLAVEGICTWYWTGDTEINSVKIADIDSDGLAEIVTGGYFNDGVRDVAQLVVWDAGTLSPLRLTTWYWTGDTCINSVDLENLDGDDQLEIVTGGYYTDGRRTAQLVVWDGATLAVEGLITWYWTSDTEINSVVAANVDDDAGIEIVTGGYFNDNSRDVAQLVVWSSDLTTVENLTTWYWTGDTRIETICVEDPDSDGSAEIITGGSYNDLSRDIAQLVIWDGSTLAVDYLTGWYWTCDTCICSVIVGNVDGDLLPEIITGGYFNDNTRNCAQTTIWEIS